MNKEIKIDEQIIIPEFFGITDTIIIPKKTHKSVDFIPEHLLTKIHSDIKVAKELCLYFLSFLIETLFETNYEGKNLLASNLAWYLRSARRETGDNNVYQNIIYALEQGTPDKGAFINVLKSYVPGEYSRKYNLTETYKCGSQGYKLKTKYVKDIVLRNTREKLIKAYTSPIAINLIKFYAYLDLPTKEELLIKGKQLVKEGYVTKKGKKLTMLHRQQKEHWKDADQRAFVEKDIEMFEVYTSYGFMIPVLGDENCPRVYDSISLLPSWIRNEIKIDGEKAYSPDYKCLHPNLAMNIYKGTTKYITHKKVADHLEMDIKDVKTKHLSFFNLESNHMKSSKLFKYYNSIESNVMNEIILDKQMHSHKITSKLLFTLENNLMSNVIVKLNKENIFVGYTYDALFVAESVVNKVVEVMNQTALEMNIYTIAECDLDTSNEVKQENNIVNQEVIETSSEESILADSKMYDDYIKENLYGMYTHRLFKLNKDKVLKELVELQLKNKKQITQKIKEILL